MSNKKCGKCFHFETYRCPNGKWPLPPVPNCRACGRYMHEKELETIEKERCGNCTHWMKWSICPKEHTGAKFITHVDSYPCSMWKVSDWYRYTPRKVTSRFELMIL